MRSPASRFFFALAACLLLTQTGCGPTVADRLAGKWVGAFELDQAAIDTKKKEAGNPIAAMVVEQLLKSAATDAKMDMELKPDGVVTTTVTGQQPSTGKWELKSSTANQATIAVVEKATARDYVLSLDPNFMSGQGGFSTPLWGPLEGLGKVRFQRAP
jgi:hypothetical protein